MNGWRQQALFALFRAVGSDTASHYTEFLALERRSPGELDAIRDERLRRVLQHALAHSPYYRAAAGSAATELAQFPVLTKSLLREQFRAIMTEPLAREHGTAGGRGRGYSWTEVKTGGSTGVPTTLIHDRSFRDRGRASRLYSQYLCGFPFGTPYFRLWGSMRDINQMNEGLAQRTMRLLARETVLNAFRMDEERMDCYLQLIATSTVDHLMAYVDAAQALAEYARRKAKPVRPLSSIMACAGTVTPDARGILRNVFGARVHNKYGSRDCADMACECDRGGLHIFAHQVHLEIVDDNGMPVPTGNQGRILVTLLGNPSFPLIRYDIGDVGALDAGTCACGRPFPLLTGLEGRTSDFLTATGGAYVSPVYIRHVIGVVHNPGFIRRFQLIQMSRTTFSLACEIPDDVDDMTFTSKIAPIERDLRVVLGADANLSITRTQHIPESDSGKFLYTINRTKTVT